MGKAVGVGKRDGLSVLDATAGLGRDAFVLADLGCKVQLCERNALIHTLLADGLTRALESDDAWLRGWPRACNCGREMPRVWCSGMGTVT